MADKAAQAAWIKRVLGVDGVASAIATAPADLTAALAMWQAALETVGQQIATLQTALRGSPDSELHDIAEFGLNALTASHKVKIQAALIDIRAGRATPRAIGAAVGLIGSFLGHIASDKRIAACDANPFGVKLSLRQTLTPPLEGLRAALQFPAS
jgi:hypothetical protein